MTSKRGPVAIYPAAVPDVAAEMGFYQLRGAGGPDKDWLEHRLGEIEDLAASAVGRLADTFNWSGQDRGPSNHACDLPHDPVHTRAACAGGHWPRCRGESWSTFVRLARAWHQGYNDRLEEAQASDPIPDHSGVILDTARNYPALVDRSWWLLVPPVGSRYMCGDCPVLMQNPVPAPPPASNMGLLVRGVILAATFSQPHVDGGGRRSSAARPRSATPARRSSRITVAHWVSRRAVRLWKGSRGSGRPGRGVGQRTAVRDCEPAPAYGGPGVARTRGVALTGARAAYVAAPWSCRCSAQSKVRGCAEP